MSDRDGEREGDGLAVLILAGFLVLLLFAGVGGVVWIFVRHQANRRECR